MSAFETSGLSGFGACKTSLWEYGFDMRDYKHLTTFPGQDKAVLKAATEVTGLSINQIIVRSVRERLPALLAEHQARKVDMDLSPLPDSAIGAAYGKLSDTDLETDRQLGRASLKAQGRKP